MALRTRSVIWGSFQAGVEKPHVLGRPYGARDARGLPCQLHCAARTIRATVPSDLRAAQASHLGRLPRSRSLGQRRAGPARSVRPWKVCPFTAGSRSATSALVLAGGAACGAALSSIPRPAFMRESPPGLYRARCVAARASPCAGGAVSSPCEEETSCDASSVTATTRLCGNCRQSRVVHGSRSSRDRTQTRGFLARALLSATVGCPLQ